MKDPKRLERYQRWKAVFDTNEGQSVMSELRRMAGQDQINLVVSIVDGKADPFLTVYREGRRSMWIDIQLCLTEPPELPEGGVDEGED
jgi:hypothetical protein